VASSGNRKELAETFKNVASFSRDNALSLLFFGNRSKGGLSSASPQLHSKRTVLHFVERQQVIGKLYRRRSQAANHFKARIIFYVLQFAVVVFD
jgi:hypothetical protein